MARRYLGLSPQAWDGLPWWEQRLYLEGYEWEELIERQSGVSTDPTVTSREVHRSGNTTITDTKHALTFSNEEGELAFLPGIAVNRI